MFEHIAQIKTEATLGKLSTFSVAVGKKPTSAESYVDDPKAVVELLGTLIKASQRENRYFSSVDLENMGTNIMSPQYIVKSTKFSDSSDKISDSFAHRAFSESNLKRVCFIDI